MIPVTHKPAEQKSGSPKIEKGGQFVIGQPVSAINPVEDHRQQYHCNQKAAMPKL